MAICVSALGSCVLLYRFIDKNSRADQLEKRLKELTDRCFSNVGPEGRRTGETAISPKRDAIATKNTTRAAILVIACNRATVKCCSDLLRGVLPRHRPSAKLLPIIVSQDCGHQPTADVIRSYGALSDVQGVRENMRSMTWYYRIRRHYKLTLGQAFDRMGYDTVLIIEDELDIGKCLVA